MKKFGWGITLILSAAALASAETPSERLQSSADVFKEVMDTPDKGIPQDLLAKAQCVIIVPGMKKGAFVVGGEFGRGFAECRHESGMGWGAPGAIRVEGGSFGAQIGGSSTDVVMLVMNQNGMNKLLGDKFTLGADASIAAGPVGRSADADTDVRMRAEILAWSRARGLFVGISLKGATLRPDSDVNEELYGRKIGNKEVLTGGTEAPAAAQSLRSELDKYSMRK
jgi:SH3 domain-containing YSC84-like protein 1